MSVVVVVLVLFGLLVATRVAGQKNRLALTVYRRAELAKACLAEGVAPDEVDALVKQKRDAELLALHRRFATRRQLGQGPFR